MKKVSYNDKSKADLESDLKALRMTVQGAVAKSAAGKNTKEYVAARKNIARIMTALTAQAKNSTEVQK